MVDQTDPKRASIPAWQMKTQDGAPDSGPKQPEKAGAGVEVSSEDRSALLEQATTFLKEASVRDAPREKKIGFLEEKGLHNDEIQTLLNTTSSSTSPSSSEEDDGVRTIHDSSTQATTDSSETPSVQTKRDTIPPIITYPEFLLRPTQPPPLITLSHLSYATYTVATISALTYGASKYLMQPMLDSLTSARHDLSSRAIHNLEELNTQLEGSVSQIPALPPRTILHRRSDADDADEDDEDPDPTELFHRDVATQTSPPRSLSITPSSSSTTTSSPAKPHQTAEERAEARLKKLHSSLISLLPVESQHPKSSTNTTTTTTTTPTQSLLTTLSATTAYLDKLQYTSNAITDYNFLHSSSSSTAPPSFDPGKTKGGSSGGGKRGGGREEDVDEAMRFRQEIRAVKGVLLSRRNFPAATAATAAVGTGNGVR